MKYIQMLWIFTGVTLTAIGLCVLFGKDGASEMLDILDKEYSERIQQLKERLQQ